MSEREFRFGVVAGQAVAGAAWAESAQRAEELGFDILLVPDTLHTLAPFPALAAAAASTRTLKIGSYVLSAPNRSPGLVAWETQTLQLLSGGRFELGLGGGRPGAERDAETLGGTFGTPGERYQRVVDTIDAVREASPETPILVAAGKPRMLRLAGERADIVALGLPPATTEDHLARVVAHLQPGHLQPGHLQPGHTQPGGAQPGGAQPGHVQAGHVQPGAAQPGQAPASEAQPAHVHRELHLNLAAVAESAADVPEWVARMVGGDPRQMAAAGGIAFLLGSPEEMAATLRRRRTEFGISYIGVGALFLERFAPVLDLLRKG